MDFDLGTARLSATDENDFIGVQIDGLGNAPGLPPFELMHSYGFASRPLDPDQSGRGCTALYATQGNEGFAWLANDPRVQSKLPNIRAGESLQYGAKGQFVRCHEDGGISLCTYVDGDPTKHAIYFLMSPTDGFRFESPWGRITFGPAGFHVRHGSGARIDMGKIAGIAAPLDALTSYIILSAAMISNNATAVAQGTDAGLTNETAVTALVALLGVLAAAIDSKSGPTTTTTAAVAAAATALANIGKVV